MSESVTPTAPDEAASTSKPKKRHTKRRVFFLILVLLWLFNNFTLKTTREEITSPKVTNEITIAALSDYHASWLGIQPETILGDLKRIDPDLVCILGDMYTDQPSGKSCDRALALMKKLLPSIRTRYTMCPASTTAPMPTWMLSGQQAFM